MERRDAASQPAARSACGLSSSLFFYPELKEAAEVYRWEARARASSLFFLLLSAADRIDPLLVSGCLMSLDRHPFTPLLFIQSIPLLSFFLISPLPHKVTARLLLYKKGASKIPPASISCHHLSFFSFSLWPRIWEWPGCRRRCPFFVCPATWLALSLASFSFLLLPLLEANTCIVNHHHSLRAGQECSAAGWCCFLLLFF